MDWVKIRESVLSWMRKYRYPVLIVLIGIVLMLLPGRNTDTEQKPVIQPQVQETENTVESSLESILSQIRGAGKVRVLLTVAKGEEILYQTDTDQVSGLDSGSLRTETVIVGDGNRQEHGLIRQTVGPLYQGAVIVCQGADQASVRLAIVQAVSSATGLGADHISVFKMK